MVDDGLFGPESIAWRIHAHPASALGGLRALLVQALHPAAVAAIEQHSLSHEDPWDRFRRTRDYLIDIVFGSCAQAESAASRVRVTHRAVRGVDPVTGGAYDARDPSLLLWVHIVLVDSFLVSHDAFAGGLSVCEADRYVAEMAVAGALVGLQPDDLPRSRSELHRCLDEYHEQLCLSPGARWVWQLLAAPPMPRVLLPLWRWTFACAAGLLPATSRHLYGYGGRLPSALDRTFVRLACGILRRLGRPPEPLRAARLRARDLGLRL